MALVALLPCLALAEPAAAPVPTPVPEAASVPATEPQADPAGEPDEPLEPIAANRAFEALDDPQGDLRSAVAQAGEMLGDWTIELAGVEITGTRLSELAQAAEDEPFLRVVREGLRRPIDLEDFVLLLDDVLVAGAAGRRGEPFFIGSGRARSAGVLVHPDEVFRGKRRAYPGKGRTVSVDKPPAQETYDPAADGDLLGPEWTMRFRNPTERYEMFVTLHEARPQATFTSRVAGLVTQLEQHGAEVYLTSFLRWRARGYLMWGAFELSRCGTEACVGGTADVLDARNKEWGLNIDIVWRHPDGWKAGKEAARRMADAYDVVYATEKGARHSNHYDGVAADFVAIGLPRELVLYAPDGEMHTFDLSDPEQTRDLSMTPELITWVETHFGFKKLRSDYPHWNDASR